MTIYWEFNLNAVRYLDDPKTEYSAIPDSDRKLTYVEDNSVGPAVITVDANTEFEYYAKNSSNIKNLEVVFMKASAPAYYRLNGSYQNLPIAKWAFITNDTSTDEITSIKLVNKTANAITFQIWLLGINTEFTGISEVY